MLNTIQPFFISFLIGLLIGIERERAQVNSAKSVGMRTFILFALLGTLAAKINAPLLTFSLSAFIFIALLLSYLRATQDNRKRENIGITTEMAAAAVFILGYLSLSHKHLAIMVAAIVLIILYGRQSLHQFAKEKIKAEEIEAALVIIIISLGIVSFLPNKTIDPWHLFNPQNFGLILLVLAGLQFGGYLMIRLFGEKSGMILLGFFGGLVSSTAVFASLSHAKKQKKHSTFSAVIAGIFATIATMMGFLLVIFLARPHLLQWITWPVLAAALFGVLSSWILMKRNHQQIKITYPNPLDILVIVKLALFIMGILIVAGAAKQYIGQSGLAITAFITGLFDIHGMAYAIAMLYKEGSLSLQTATEILALVLLASFVSKFALVWGIAHNRFSIIITLFLLGMLMSGAGVFWALYTWM